MCSQATHARTHTQTLIQGVAEKTETGSPQLNLHVQGWCKNNKEFITRTRTSSQMNTETMAKLKYSKLVFN